MKKILLLSYLLLFELHAYSQIAVNGKNLKKAHFRHLDEIYTIFILPEIYKKTTYDSILKSNWHLTPYEVVSVNDFNLKNYTGNQYIFAEVKAYKTGKYKNKKSLKKIKTYSLIDFYTYNYKKIDKLKKKLYQKKLKNKHIADIFAENKITIAHVLLYPTGEFNMFVIKNKPGEKKKRLNNDNVFYNFTPGFLKNYLQKVENLIKNEGKYKLKDKAFLPEIKNLKHNTLYVPDYIARVYNPFGYSYGNPDKLFIENLFKNYKYKYQLIDTNELNRKIMNNEPVYYLQFVRLNNDRFIEIVNAQTGEVVLKSYEPVVNSFNLEPGFIKDLNNVIKKAVE